MNRHALRTLLKIITAVWVIAIVGVIAFTFVQWGIFKEDNAEQHYSMK